MELQLKCRVVLEAPPADVAFALQMGHGADIELAQKQRSTGKDLQFELTIPVLGSNEQAMPDFRGP